MGYYADIKVESLSLMLFKNRLDNTIVNLFFGKEDLVITPNCQFDADDEDASFYTKYEYITTVANAKDRLDAQGYGLSNFEAVFNKTYLEAIDYFPFLCQLKVDYEDIDRKAEERANKNVTFNKWKNSIAKIVKYELKNGSINQSTVREKVGINTECDKIIFYSLIDDDYASYYGLDIEIIYIAYVFRLILEFCPDDSEIILDFSDLENWSVDSIEGAMDASNEIQKTIVLVEGTSDKDILEFGMKMIYPHLTDLFYFMDFEDDKLSHKREGGTSFVEKNLETFYYSRTKVNFIAIFDNDAAGYKSKCELFNMISQWPSNFRILQYPELPLFKKYPTIAPNESVLLDDINNKACSIELYLPDNIIKENDEYLPIEWETRITAKPNNKKIKIYQGVISKKEQIKEMFHKEKRAIERGEKEFNLQEWKRLQILLSSIVFAFK